MEEKPPEEIQEKILASFSNSKYIGIKKEYTLGFSDSRVLAAGFELEYQYDSKIINGLDGTYIVKIGSDIWSESVKNFYQKLPKNEATRSLVIPYHMRSCPVEGYRGVAYGVAFDSLLEPQPLLNILDEKSNHEKETQKQIEDLSKSLADWYLSNQTTTEIMNPYELIINMLTNARAEKLVKKGATILPDWSLNDPQIHFDGSGKILPNPLFYLQSTSWATSKDYNKPTCFFTLIHGDLHTGNVICYPQSIHKPMLIDFDQSIEKGIPFFDLAYLEYDIIRHILPVDKPGNRESFLSLLNYSMNTILGDQNSPGWDANIPWNLILPLRQVVNRLKTGWHEDAELIWWLATVTVGLNFAQKGDETRSSYERMAGLIYAAFGLERAFAANHQKLLSGPSCYIHWINKDPIPHHTANHKETTQKVLKTRGANIVEELSNASGIFTEDRHILWKECSAIEAMLKQMGDFLEKLEDILSKDNFSLLNAKNKQSRVLGLINILKISHPPSSSQDNLPRNYKKDLNNTYNEVQKLLRDVNSILQEL
jgi:hypothetical protein